MCPPSAPCSCACLGATAPDPGRQGGHTCNVECNEHFNCAVGNVECTEYNEDSLPGADVEPGVCPHGGARHGATHHRVHTPAVARTLEHTRVYTAL